MKLGYNSLLSLWVAVFMACASAWAGGAININTATVSELQSVQGIGEKTAAKIVAYRNEHGAFSQVDDLLSVRGFGQKKLSKARDALSVSDEAGQEQPGD